MICAILAARESGGCNGQDSKLGEVPVKINEDFSCVLGDGFHFMDCPKVPIHHELKKGYFFALKEAWFPWDRDLMDIVKYKLRGSMLGEKRYEGKLTSFIESDVEKRIKAKLYFNKSWFCERVPRKVLPPSKLYPCVHAMYELYGPKVDSITKMPLFGKTAWAKAKNVLKDILVGYALDPPGYSFYTQRLDNKGELAFDSLGIALIN